MRFCVLPLIAALVLAAPAAAAPELEVHARTELRLGAIRKDYDDRYVLSGQLVDRFSGQGIAHQEVSLAIAGRTYRVYTGEDGTFEVRVAAPAGKQDIEVRFEGADFLDQAQVVVEDVDVTKNPVDLAIATAGDNAAARITVTATTGGAAVQLPVDLYVGPAEADPDDLVKKATVTTGGAPFVLTRKDAGGAGDRRVRAVFRGDDVYNPATADATVELATSTTTSLTAGGAEVAYEDDVTLRGTVTDEDGRGVPRAPVALQADGRRVAQAVTGGDGAFRFSIEGETLGVGPRALQAVVEPTEGWMRASRSEVVHVTVAAPQPVPLSYTIAAFAITALVAAGFFAARNRPWQKLRRAAPGDGERPPGEAPAEPAAGLVLARPSLVSTLRRAADHGVSGLVRDAIRHRPLAGARVALRLGDAVQVAITGADGAFAFEDLAPGEWRAEVALAAHVTERFAVTIPHRGELRGARVDLMPVRERIFTLYKRAALPLLPDPARWGVWSPRQVFEHVRRRQPARALAELTDFVEASYFSAELPGEDRLPEAEGRVEAALREQVV